MKKFTTVNQMSLFGNFIEMEPPASVAVLLPVPKAVEKLINPRQLFGLKSSHYDSLGNSASKVKANLTAVAIALAKGVKTAEDKDAIAAYTGWGGISSMFVEGGEFESERIAFSELVGDSAYKQARDSVLTAYYTEPDYIHAMWMLAETMGFKGGSVLEPSAGTGNFIGAMPEHLREASTVTMVEPDFVSASICKALYADSKTIVHTAGLEVAPLRSESFDVVIGNVPFGNFRVHDSKFDGLKLPIHDYAIAKSLDLVRSGGLVLLITSTGTMDKINSNFRNYVAERAELVKAVRLPSGAFARLGGTDVATDILVLRKKGESLATIEPSSFKNSQARTVRHEDTSKWQVVNAQINEYFVGKPDHVLGQAFADTNQFGGCVRYAPKLAWKEQLKSLCSHASLGGLYTGVERSLDTRVMAIDTSGLKSALSSGYFFDEQGELHYMLNQNVESQSHLPLTKRKRLEGMTRIRDCVVELLEKDAVGADCVFARATLNRLYNDFVGQFDYLMKPVNRRLFSLDSHAPLLWSLERYDDEEEKAVKTDIFTKSTVSSAVLSETAESLGDAIALSYNRFGRMNLSFMAKAMSIAELDVVDKLTEAGRVYFDPDLQEHVDSEIYLSGNVYNKLQIARAAADGDERYLLNVAALEAVVPSLVPLTKISIQLGVPWIGQADVQAFVDEVVLKLADEESQNDATSIKITQLTGMATWTVMMERNLKKRTTFTVDWGTLSKGFADILDDLLNQRSPTVYMEIDMGEGRTKRVVDKNETLAARDKAEKIQSAFLAWVFADQTRVARLETVYNSTFNGTVNRDYDGSHLVVPGLSSTVKLRSDQKDGIWAGLVGGNKLFAYAVGGGKTLITICLAQMMKRLGLANKPTIVVPNHMLEEFAGQYARAFPRARILAASKEDLDGDKRRVLMMRIAMEDWDCIIITHGSFGKIALNKAVVQDYADEVGDKLEAMVRGSDDSNVVREAARQKKVVVAKILALGDKGKKDEGVMTFDQLGIDQLLVDEADLFKNLWFQTKKSRVPGLSGACSGRAMDLFLKSRIIFSRRQDNFGLVFATATPIANTIGEMFIMQTYLQPQRLRELGIDGFDAWAANFAREVTSIEVTPEGSGYRLHTRFSQFVNVPELMLIFKGVALIRSKKMLALPEPEVFGGKHTIVAVSASEAQKAYVQKLVKRAGEIRNGTVKPSEDNMLCVTGDGRRAALDMRCVNGLEMDHPGSKLNACIQNVYRHWVDGAATKLTQLVFCDLSTPKPYAFSVYTDMRAKLMEMGVPIEEIAFAQDYDTTIKKGDLHRKVRAGRIRILVGSTELMGFGTNVQDLLVAEHHLDAPWRPRDVEQRDGRIVRFGNRNKTVYIYRYVTESTFDAYMWQTLERKAGFIEQVMEGKSECRNVEDVTSQALSFAEVKAIASGNPLVIEKAGIDAEVSKILSLKTSWRSDRESLLTKAANRMSAIEYAEKRIAALDTELSDIGDVSQVNIAGARMDASEATAKHLMTYLTAKKAAMVTSDYRQQTVNNVLSIGNMQVGIHSSGKKGNTSFDFFIIGKSGVSFALRMPYGAADVLQFLKSKSLESELLNMLAQNRARLISEKEELNNVQRGAEKPFEYAERLETALTKQEAIDKSLGLMDDDVSTLHMDEEQTEEEAEMA